MNVNREELAWAAGLFDGEGFIGHLKTSSAKYLHLRLSVGQTDAPMLHRLNQALWNLGRVSGPTILPHRKPFWVLNINGFEACQAAIAAMWPWLSQPKRCQAKKALLAQLQYAKTVRKHVRRMIR